MNRSFTTKACRVVMFCLALSSWRSEPAYASCPVFWYTFEQAICWQQFIDGTDHTDGSSDYAGSAVVDSAGYVIVSGGLGNGGTSSDSTVVKFRGDTGEEVWRQTLDLAQRPSNLGVFAVDSADDVFLFGNILAAPGDYIFTVMKLDGATGAEMWRQEINQGMPFGPEVEFAASGALDSSGDVIVGGALADSLGFGLDFTVIKFDGATGNEIWRQEIDGTYSPPDGDDDHANAVVVDAAGDVIAAGKLENSDFKEGFFVVKLGGSTGTELWRQAIQGTGSTSGEVFSLALDGAGDAIAGGLLKNESTFGDGFVVKLRGDTGEELWRKLWAGGFGNRFYARVDGAGDVIVNGKDSGHALVIKLDGSSGTEIWQQGIRELIVPNNVSTFYFSYVSSVLIDSAGDVIAADASWSPSVIKFDGSTGAPIWGGRVPLHTMSAVALDGGGDVIAAGNGCGSAFTTNGFDWNYYCDKGGSFAVIKFDGNSGPLDPLFGDQSADQEKCINALNKRGVKVAAAQGKENTSCIKKAGKGKETDPEDCLTRDDKGKVSKAAAKVQEDFDKRCAAETPDFGVPGVEAGTAAAVATAAIDAETELVADVFGQSLNDAIDTSKDGRRCQAAVSKDCEKLAAAAGRSFLKCKKTVLLWASNAEMLEEWCWALSTPSADAKVAKAFEKLEADVGKKCGGVDLDGAFPGRCVGRADFAPCVRELVLCRVCLMFNQMDGLTTDCDAVDDGASNASCPGGG